MKFIDSILKNLKLLYVEDDEFARDEIADFLEFEVGELKTASNGEEGLEIFKTFHPDIVITDINMPKMNGLDMAKNIKSISPNTPIIVTSAYSDSDYIIKAIEIGINRYVLKPIDVDELLTMIIQSTKELFFEESIEARDEYIKFLIDSNPSFMLVLTDKEMEYINKTFLEFLGYKDEKEFLVAHQNLDELTVPSVSELILDIMSDKEAFMLIFKPGFSTAAKVTSVSGRGVGMDVVKTNVEKLNGIIEIDSLKGKGSVFKIKIPLTLAIIQALLVTAQEELFAVPLANVIETVRITMEDISTVEGKSVLKLRDEILPLVNMSDIFKIEKILGINQYLYVVVLGVGASKVGLIVDGLIGQEEIVIKSLGEFLKGLPGIAGATIRGDGRVTLIVDVGSLMRLAKETHNKKIVTESLREAQKKKEKPSDYTVLLVDDSAMDRKIMRNALEELGVNLIEAKDGLEALQILKHNEIDAMLIDIEMPRMDGYTLATEIKKYNRYKNLPLIAVTSRTGKSDRMRGVESGMVEYITKPYSADYLSSVVQRNAKIKAEFL